MISLEELKEYARLKKLNLGQAEKEYFQNIVLFILYEHFGKELIFKGGTALSRAYGLERFSEDLDFTLSRLVDIHTILEAGFKKFFLDAEIIEEKNQNSFNYIVRIKGPLYMGRRESFCKIELDISLREKIFLDPKLVTLGRLLKELPSFDVPVMDMREILAEKVRAIMTRTKARDVYDIWFLLKEETPVDVLLINEKLKYYEIIYSLKEFKKHLVFKKDIWVSELSPLIRVVPLFHDVHKFIMEKMPE